MSGCSSVGSDASGGLLETSQRSYDAKHLTEGYERYVIDIPYVTRNTTPDTLVLIGCRVPHPPTLQKRTEGEWKAVYSPVVQLCLSPPFKIAPGETRRDTFEVVAALPEQNIEPVFEADEIEGTYRLTRSIYERVGEDGLGAGLLPFEQRISNTFRLK